MTGTEFLSAAQLKEAFDKGFQRPPLAPPTGRVRLLMIRVGDESLALRIDQLHGIASATGIAALPQGKSAMLGLAATRQSLMAVYDLGSLLGVSSGEDHPRWLARCGSKGTVGLGFAAVEGVFDVGPEMLYPVNQAEERADHIEATARVGPLMRRVVSISSVLGAIEQIAGRVQRSDPGPQE